MTPLFLCGFPRSGTTYLLSLLDDHPQLLVFPEETRLRKMLDYSPEKRLEYLLRKIEVMATPSLEGHRVVGSGVGEYRVENFQRFRAHLIERFQASGGSAADLLDSLFQAYGAEVGKNAEDMKYCVEKTPSNELFLEQFFGFWPRARAVLIVRDPRAAVHSAFQKKQRGKLSFEGHVEEWGRSLLAWTASSARFPDRCLLLRYEDLVSDTERSMKRLSAFLEIDFEPSLLVTTKMGHEWTGVSSTGSTVKGFRAALHERWRDDLDPERLRLIENCFAPAMRILGYPLTKPRASLFAMMGPAFRSSHGLKLLKNAWRLRRLPEAERSRLRPDA